MEELNNSKLQQKINAIYKNILKLKKVEVDNNYCAKLLDWFNEVICKNIAIYNSKKDEEAVIKNYIKRNVSMCIRLILEEILEVNSVIVILQL